MPERRFGKSRRARREVVRWLCATCGVCVLLTLSCNRSKAGRAESARAENAPTRGERVVVEQTAAVFFEGRVLSVDGERLRVQTANTGETLQVSTSDAYALSRAGREPRSSGFAICGTESTEWQACQVVRKEGASVHVLDAKGQALAVPKHRVLPPTPVTELNLRRHFQRLGERRSFVQALERAGRPAAPQGWKPSMHERVLGRHEGAWFSAVVSDVEDETAEVRWRADDRITELTFEQLVPEPPYTSPLKRGDFVLAPPAQGNQAWAPVKVVAVSGSELETVNVNGERRRVGTREVVPLRPGETGTAL
jgi:hypothetical protein